MTPSEIALTTVETGLATKLQEGNARRGDGVNTRTNFLEREPE